MTHLKYILAATGLLLAAQGTPDVLGHLPAQAKSYTYFPHPAVSSRSFQATASLFTQERESFVGKSYVTTWGLDLDAFEGGVLLAEMGGDPANPGRMLLLGTENPEATLKTLKARREGEGWTYRLAGSGKKPGALRHAAVRDGVLILSTKAELLAAAAAVEDVSAIRPWTEGLDLVAGVTRKTMAEGLAQAKMGLAMLQAMPDQAPAAGDDPKAKEVAANLAAVKPVLKLVGPFLEKLDASAETAAFGVGFRPDGVKVKGQVFFKAGSPLGAEAIQLPKGTRLQGLSGTEHILAGGISGQVLAPLSTFGTTLLQAMAGDKVDKALVKRWETAQEVTAKGLVNIAWTVALPGKTGAPLLTGIQGVMKVMDARAHLVAMADSQELSAQMMKALPGAMATPFAMTVQRDVLPDVQSLTMTMDLSSLTGGKGLPPQAGMAMAMLMGGPRLQVSAGVLDDTTLVMAMGDAASLKESLARVKAGASLEQQPAVQKALGLLPEGAFMQMLFSPAGLVQAAKTVMTTFNVPQPVPFPACSDSQMALGLSWTAKGLGMEGIAPTDALKDLGGIVKTFEAMDQKKAGAPKGAKPARKPAKK